jgi:hypothetical protein
MTSIASDGVSIAFDVRRLCDLCRFPSWSKETSSGEYEISLESFAEVSVSAGEGCNGCKLFLHVWQYAIPNANDRENSTLNFNKSKENLWVHVFCNRIFTLHGKHRFG